MCGGNWLGALFGQGGQPGLFQLATQPPAAPAAPAAAVKLKSKSLLSAQGAGDTSTANTSGITAYGKTTLGA